MISALTLVKVKNKDISEVHQVDATPILLGYY